VIVISSTSGTTCGAAASFFFSSWRSIRTMFPSPMTALTVDVVGLRSPRRLTRGGRGV
jgi:hypothetical protein